jgi:hypothetical protein
MRLSLRAGAAIAVVLATVLNVAGVFSEEAIHWLNLFVGFAFAVLWASLVFGLLARWAGRSSTRAWLVGLACAILGVLAVVAFWSALPPVLGMAGVYLGLVAYASGRRVGAVAAAVGILAIALDAVMYATDIASRV